MPQKTGVPSYSKRFVNIHAVESTVCSKNSFFKRVKKSCQYTYLCVSLSTCVAHFPLMGTVYTDKKENQIFLMCKEIQSGALAKSYMNNGLLIYREIFTHFLIY